MSNNLINLLPEHIASQIAAGEVVQRPASVIKELVENAVDAQATKITVHVREAGRVMIQVVDNGMGMSETDARLCFERHATSKINDVSDIFHIRTMGFRGEAMASIAAIAHVELKTRRKQDEIGTVVKIEGSVIKSQSPAALPEGTSISVGHLFYNTPARRNFLKSDNVEMRHITEEFQRVALAHPNITFTLTHNGREAMTLPAGSARQRVIGILGKQAADRIVAIKEDTDVVRVSGFLGRPEHARRSRAAQYLFVNNRFIRSAYLHHATMRAYEGLMAPGNHPQYVLFLEIDPERLDVNVHPTKQELKFEDESAIYAVVHAAVKGALGGLGMAPVLDFDQASGIKDLGFTPTNPVAPTSNGGGQASWQKVFEIANGPARAQVTVPSNWDQPQAMESSGPRPYQIHQRYILSQIKSGFILVDQQAAHERVAYEDAIRSLEKGGVSMQKLLFPQTLTYPASDAQLMLGMLDSLRQLGYDIQDFGSGSFVVHAVPAEYAHLNLEETLDRNLEHYKHFSGELKTATTESLARSMALSRGLKAGQKLEIEEMRTLLDQLFACNQPGLTPGGKKTMITVTMDDLARQFGN